MSEDLGLLHIGWNAMLSASIGLNVWAMKRQVKATDDNRAEVEKVRNQLNAFEKEVARDYTPRAETQRAFDQLRADMQAGVEDIKDYIKAMLGKK